MDTKNETLAQTIEDLKKQLSTQQIKNNAELESVCWFCKSNSPFEKKQWAKVCLRKVISRTSNWEKSKELNIIVPRCERCYKIHRRLSWIIRYFLAAFFGPIVIMLLGIMDNAEEASWAIIEYIMISAWVVLILGIILYFVTFPKDTRKKNYSNQYPPVIYAKEQGYRGFLGRLFS